MDCANFSANERVDLVDLNYVAQETPIEFAREPWAYFGMDPAADAPAYVVSGFQASNPAGNQVQVALGVALLGRRVGLRISYGVFTATGDATQSLDISSYQRGTYGVYIKFDQQLSAEANRTFWQTAEGGSEYAQSTPTRIASTWQLTITPQQPGDEWLQIAQVAMPGCVVTDMRPMYFEGRVDQNFGSTWGAGQNDRNVDRANYGIKDLQTFVSAMRTALEDVKGPGLTRWWENKIGGQNIGFAGNATLGRTAWGDASFFAQGDASQPSISFDAKSALVYNRQNQTLGFNFNNASALQLTASTLSLPSAVNVGLSSAASVRLQSQASSASVLYAASGQNPLFETRGNFNSTLSALGFYSTSVLAGQLDANQRWLFGTDSISYVYPTSPAAVSIANSSGDTLLRLDASAKSGVAAMLSLRANNAATAIRFTPSGTSQSSTASFLLQAQPQSFALVDVPAGSNVFSYNPSTKVLDLSGSYPTSGAYYIPSNFTQDLRANIYQWVQPFDSTVRVTVSPNGGCITMSGSGQLFFPIQLPRGSTIILVTLRTSRATTSTTNFNAAMTLYANNIFMAAGAIPTATSLATVGVTVSPNPAGSGITYNVSTGPISVSSANYQNFFVSFSDSDSNATNNIFSIAVRYTVPSIPAPLI